MSNLRRRTKHVPINSAHIEIDLTLGKGIRLSIFDHVHTGNPKRILASIKRTIARAEKQVARFS